VRETLRAGAPSARRSSCARCNTCNLRAHDLRGLYAAHLLGRGLENAAGGFTCAFALDCLKFLRLNQLNLRHHGLSRVTVAA
jgi:hypothetical protein